jgi:predicted  nucleic acid-binding Zn-ribbon protein
MAFKDISIALDSALQDLDSKKKVLDKANAAADKALSDYRSSMENAQSLRQQLTDSLAQVMPAMPDNVRVSGGKAA